MKIKKLLCLILCALLVASALFALVACGPNEDGGGNVSANKNPKPDHNNYTTIRLNSYNGGVGINWLYKALTRFQEKYKDYEFEPGKHGIYVDVSTDSSEDMSQKLDSSASHILIDERHSNIFDLGANGKILPIDDVLSSTKEESTSIESRLVEGVKEGLIGVDRHYYALPMYDIYPGLTYDREAFADERWYLAKDAENGEEYQFKNSSIKGYFIKNEGSAKSCGPDGLYGTYDDGLPSSLEELILVCDKISKRGHYPFTWSGQWQQNFNYLVQGLWAALAGYEEMSAVYTFSGEVEVVTGIKSTPLIDGINYVYDIETETVTLNEENGYLAHETASKYYIMAFVKIAQQEGWFSPDSTGATGNVEAMQKFVLNKYSKEQKRRAFLIEGNYWYNEIGMDSNTLELYKKQYKKTPDVAPMPLPTVVRTSDVQVGTKHQQTLMDNAVCVMYLNAQYKDQTDIINACKMLMEYLLTTQENIEFTKETGLTRAFNYSVEESQLENLSLFHKANYVYAKDSVVVYNSSPSNTFKKNALTLQISFSSAMVRAFSSISFFEAYRTENKTVEEVFNNKKMSQSLYESYRNK